MTREGEDGINSDAASMNHQIAVVAYYIDGPFAWTAAEIAMFPNSVHIRIATRASTRDGNVIDCETGDATPAQAAAWAHQRRADGYPYPMVYTSISNQAAVIAAFAAIHEPLPGWWLAHYDNLDVLPAGALGKQYANPGPLDKSIWADFIPGVDQETDVQLTDPVISPITGKELDNVGNVLFWTNHYVNQIPALTAQNAGLVAAVQTLATNPAVTAAQIQQYIDDAVAQHVAITGTVQIGAAPAVVAAAAPNPA